MMSTILYRLYLNALQAMQCSAQVLAGLAGSLCLKLTSLQRLSLVCALLNNIATAGRLHAAVAKTV